MLLVLISPFIPVLVCAEQGLAEYTGTFYLDYKALDRGYINDPLLVDPVQTMWIRIVTLTIIGALIVPPVVAVIFLVLYVKRRRP
jgi:hypothetical protein